MRETGEKWQRELITDIKRKKVYRLAANKIFKCTKTNKEQNDKRTKNE